MSLRGRLGGRGAINTGAGAGMSEGIARKLAFEGASIVVIEINKQNADNVATDLNCILAEKKAAVTVISDVTKAEDWNKAVEPCANVFSGGRGGALDIVVDNTSAVHRAACCRINARLVEPSPQVPLSEYSRVMETNALQLYHSTAVAHSTFAAQKTRRLRNSISSISGPRPKPNLVWYAGSKGAVSTITRGLAAEFVKDNVRCNAALPVAVDTGMLSDVMGGEDTEVERTKLTGGIPLERFAIGEDGGNAVAWLASDEAGFVTGVEWPVDGGRSLM